MLTRTAALAALAFQHTYECSGNDFYEFMGFRGDLLLSCRGCGRSAPVDRLLRYVETDDSDDAANRGRYRLDCCRCGRPMYLHRPEARLPLCQNCARKRR